MKSLAIAAMVVAGVAFVGAETAQAGQYSFSFHSGRYGNSYGFSYGGGIGPGCGLNYGNRGYRNFGNYGNYGYGVPSYQRFGSYNYHPRGPHLDYHPGHFDVHRNHLHYHPGHYDLHR